MKISRPNPKTIIITKSKLLNLSYLAFYVICICIWYYIALGIKSMPDGANLFDFVWNKLSDYPIMWAILLAPLLALSRIVKSLKVFFQGEGFVFDGNMRIINKNNDKVALFSEVDGLQIRTIGGESEEHRLSIKLHSGNKIEIHSSSSLKEIDKISDDIADILEVGVVRV
ncbi:MAG: hypothetical protein ABFS12_18605 [Bacteroidota bacterium]